MTTGKRESERGATAEYKCQHCREPFTARTADRKRGWARFCSKSCKAKKQEKRTGQYSNYRNSGVDRTTYIEHAREYGGIPQFDRHGEYEGFRDQGFDNTSCQNSDKE